MPKVMAGTEVYAHTLASIQKSKGDNVAVIIPHFEYYAKGEYLPQYQYDGIDVYSFLESGNPTDRQIHYGFKKPEGIRKFTELLLKLKPDVVHFHELNRSIGFTVEHVKAAKRLSLKVFLTAHLSFYTCNTNVLVNDGKLCNGKIDTAICTDCTYKSNFRIARPFSKWLMRLSLWANRFSFVAKLKDGKLKTLLMMPVIIRRVKNELQELTENLDRFICYAKWYENILLENGVPQNKIKLVPSALVTPRKNLHPVLVNNVKKPVRLVFVGRVQKQKGIHLIIQAMRVFSRDEVYIDIYGKKENSDYFLTCIKESAELDNVNWKGMLERNKVLETLSEYDMLCLPSTFSEMSPLVIQEAFMAGIPVIASKVCGNSEQIRHGENGLLFEFNSVTSLKEQIRLLVDNPEIIQRMKSKVVLPPHFGLVAEIYSDIYQSS